MDTSGVIMAAKNNNAHRSLALQLAEHSITRKYNAIVYNNIKEDEGTIDKPLGRNPSDRKKMAVVPGGRRAVTHYRVLDRLGKFTYIEAQLETGRTHQIRVHMTYAGQMCIRDRIEDCDSVKIYQGTAINPAHQDLAFKMDFTYKINQMNELTQLLEKMGKDVEVTYI